MRRIGRLGFKMLALMALSGCRGTEPKDAVFAAQIGRSGPTAPRAPATDVAEVRRNFAGFDRNDYPGDSRLLELRKHFAFTGYWLNAPPGETASSWTGHRQVVRAADFGFLVLFNGHLDKQILAAGRKGTKPGELGARDAAQAIAAAVAEGFPAGTTLFLDQEEGGRLLPEQAGYFFGWTEAIAVSRYKPGAYLSGQADPDGIAPDGKPLTITTAEDVKQRVASGRLHPVALWVYQDACPPAPGCTAEPPALDRSGTPDALVWQYAQSPRRPANTVSCVKTYAPDGMCYAGASTDLFLDVDVAGEADPSHGR